MVKSSSSSIAATLLLAGAASGFGVVVAPASRLARPTTTTVTATVTTTTPTATALSMAIRSEEKSYQLEEREDADDCTTELFLYGDKSVWFGETDGVPYAEAAGRWDVDAGTNDFRMRVARKYGAGQPKTDMGEFEYEIERFYTGEMTMVGANVGITGIISAATGFDVMSGAPNEFAEVGYFNMIDATDERLGYEGKADELAARALADQVEKKGKVGHWGRFEGQTPQVEQQGGYDQGQGQQVQVQQQQQQQEEGGGGWTGAAWAPW